MPRRYAAGGESRLSLEGLRGKVVEGKTVASVFAHEGGPSRTFYFTDGTYKVMPKWQAIGVFLAGKGYEVDDGTTKAKYGR